jgi:hypothetical protein
MIAPYLSGIFFASSRKREAASSTSMKSGHLSCPCSLRLQLIPSPMTALRQKLQSVTHIFLPVHESGLIPALSISHSPINKPH